MSVKLISLPGAKPDRCVVCEIRQTDCLVLNGIDPADRYVFEASAGRENGFEITGGVPRWLHNCATAAPYATGVGESANESCHL